MSFLQVLQDTTKAPPSFIQGAAEQIPGVVVGALLGFLLTVVIQRWRAREAREAAARDLISVAKVALRRLNTRTQHLDSARNADHAALVAFGQLYSVLWDGPDAALFRDAIQSGTRLSLTSLNAWRDSAAALDAAQTSHGLSLSHTVMPGQPAIDARATTYRQALVDAKARIHAALGTTRKHADKECALAIDQLLQE